MFRVGDNNLLHVYVRLVDCMHWYLRKLLLLAERRVQLSAPYFLINVYNSKIPSLIMFWFLILFFVFLLNIYSKYFNKNFE